jgi:Zn-dependent protease with chaperone function
VVTQDEAADAYTLPGWPARIVITSGMLRALSSRERQVLLAHERTHAAASHYLFTAAARLAAAANPLLRPLAAAVGYTVERWADERAAAAAGDRALAATAIARAALAAKAAPPRQAFALGIAGLGIAGRTWSGGSGPGPVPRRVAALLRPPPRLRLLLTAGIVALVAASAVAALDAGYSMHQFVEYAQGPGA